MGLKQLLIGRVGAALLAILAALHAFSNPLDTDNDSVLDDFDDCPTSMGHLATRAVLALRAKSVS